jgi:hypothetical protein
MVSHQGIGRVVAFLKKWPNNEIRATFQWLSTEVYCSTIDCKIKFVHKFCFWFKVVSKYFPIKMSKSATQQKESSPISSKTRFFIRKNDALKTS